MADQDQDEQRNRAVDIAQGNFAPNTIIGQPLLGQPAPGVYLGASGENLGTTQNTPPPQGVTGVQGQLSPQEQQFWSANPAGAVVHPQTGELIGLGERPAQYSGQPTPTYTGVGAPQPGTPSQYTGIGAPQPQATQVSRQPPPDFVQIPQIDPAIAAQRQNLSGEIANVQDQLRGASTARGRHGAQSSAEMLQARLNYLQRAESGLAQQQFKQQSEQATASHQNVQMQQKWSIDRDATAFNNGLAGLPPVTDPGYKAALYKLDRDNPDARKDPRIEAFLLAAAKEHDWRTEAEARAREAGLTIEQTGIGQRGPTEKFVNPQSIPSKFQTRYDVLQAAIKGHLEQSAKQAKETTRPDVQYKNAATLHAQQAEATSLEKQFPGLKPKPPQVRQNGVIYNLQPDGSYK